MRYGILSRRGRNRVHDDAAAEALLDAAELLLDAEGVSRLTVRRVAERVAVSTRAVYSTLGSKTGMIHGLGVRAHATLGSMVDALPGPATQQRTWRQPEWTASGPSPSATRACSTSAFSPRRLHRRRARTYARRRPCPGYPHRAPEAASCRRPRQQAAAGWPHSSFTPPARARPSPNSEAPSHTRPIPWNLGGGLAALVEGWQPANTP